MREAKPAPKIESLRSSFNQQWIIETREYEVITFLMGGGVEPYEADPITTVRAAEIKGWLRYWWRATRGGMFNGNLDKMREREAEIWGWSGMEIEQDGKKKRLGQSKVQIEVEILSKGVSVTHFQTSKGEVPIYHWRSPYSYVAFPLQPPKEERHRPPRPVYQGVKFKLLLRYPADVQKDVHAALWAWEIFGGVGARTRRGFGALKRVDSQEVYPSSDQVEAWIRRHLNTYVNASLWPKDVPHLSPSMGLVVKFKFFVSDPLQVWQRLIAALKRFRQDRPGYGTRHPGQSHWPEPDEIRRLWVKRAHLKKPLAHQPSHPVSKFPRGQMGLPIVFHFKLDKEQKKRFVEPPDVTLQGASHERWASRLILKAIPCQGGYVGLAAVLDGPNKPPGGWKLTGAVIERVEATLTYQDAQQIPMLNGEPDVLQAFLNFLESE